MIIEHVRWHAWRTTENDNKRIGLLAFTETLNNVPDKPTMEAVLEYAINNRFHPMYIQRSRFSSFFGKHLTKTSQDIKDLHRHLKNNLIIKRIPELDKYYAKGTYPLR